MLFVVLLQPMRLAVHIFTIYMLALSLVPCSDNGGGIVEIANHLFGIKHQQFSAHEQHSNSCGDDTCTPFCICNCCSVALDISAKPTFQVKTLLPTPIKSPAYFSDFIAYPFYQSIWQPPRFS